MVNLQTNFDIAKYLGRWFEIARTSNITFERGTDIVAEYSLDKKNSIKVKNSQFIEDKSKWETVVGNAVVSDAETPAYLKVKFSFFMPRGNYKVIYTDYDSLAIVYSDFSIFCGLFDKKMAWILSRTKELSPEKMQKAFELIEKELGLKEEIFLRTVQTSRELQPSQ